MYNRTFWQDHVTEFDDRFREQNNNDGTVTHIPVEGEIIQEGTPQNAANFNNIEMGIFAANEIAAELARIALSRGGGTGETSGGTGGAGGEAPNATKVLYQKIEIPANGWGTSDRGRYVDVLVEGVTADMIPIISIPHTPTQGEGIPAFYSAETADGYIRFYAKSDPQTALYAIAILIVPFAVSSGASVLKPASSADVKEIINSIFNNRI